MNGLEIEWVDPKTLKPHPRNYRNHPEEQMVHIVQSIEADGIYKNIVIANDDTLLAGHGINEGAIRLGMERVPVKRMPYGPDDIRALKLLEKDNEIARAAEDDLGGLVEILKEIAEFDIDGLLGTGFDDESLQRLIEETHAPFEPVTGAGGDEFDTTPDDGPTRAQRGDLWQMGEHRLLVDDCTIAANVARLMGGEKADMVFTDPPYNALKSWDKDETKGETRLDPSKWFQNDNMEWGEFEAFLLRAFKGLSGHSAYICCDYRIYPLVVNCIEASGYDLKHCIVWKKNVWGLGKRYRFQHEFIVYACRKDAPFHGDRSQSDVWEVGVDRVTEHNTPKPVGLPSIAIGNSSEQGAIVFDGFGGSGTTLIAAERLNRRARLMEIEPRYADVILRRWEAETGKEAELVSKVTV